MPDDFLSQFIKSQTSGNVQPLLDRMRGATSGQESGGNTRAINPRTSASGEFQILPDNIGPWTEKHLKRRMSQSEFLANPDAQRQVFDAEMGTYLKKAKARGVDDDTAIRMAAAGWYGGEGAMHRYNDDWRPRPNEPSFREYTSSVLKRAKGSTPQLPVIGDFTTEFVKNQKAGATQQPATVADTPDYMGEFIKSQTGSPTNPTGANANIDIKPVPEKPETIQAQVNSTIDANSPKAATLLTEDSQIQLLDPSLIKGLKQVKTPNGTLLVNPKKAKTLGVSDYRRDMAKLIGKVEDVGDATATGTAVVTKAPDGTELSSSIVTTPEAAQQQAAVDAQAFPQAASQEVKPAESVIAERETELLRGPVTEESDLLFDLATGGTQATPPVGSQPGDIYKAWLAKNGLSDDKASKDSFAVEQQAEAARIADEKALQEPQAPGRPSQPVSRKASVQRQDALPVGQLSQPRQIGAQNEDFNRVAGEFTPSQARNAEDASRQAAIVVGRQYGITPEQVNRYFAQRRAEGTAPLVGEFVKGQVIQVPFSVLDEIDGGTGRIREAVRIEQSQGRTNPNVGLDLRVDEDEAYKRLGYSTPQEAADWLNSNAGNALIAVNPMFAFLEKEQRDNIGASFAGGVMGSGARAWRSLAGLARVVDPAFIAGLTQEGGEETLRKNPLHDKSAENLYRYMQSIAEPAKSLEAKTGDGGIVSMVAKIAGGAVGDVPRIMLLSKLPTGAVVGMGADMGLQSAGRGDKASEVGSQFTKGALLGGVFKAAPIIGRLVGEFPVASVTSNALARSIGRQVGTVATIAEGSALVEQLYGSTEEQQLQTAIVNSLFHLASNGVQLAGKKVRARDAEGNEVTVGVDKDGSVKLLKGQEGKAKPDMEMFVDVTKGPDGVYRAAGDTSAVRTPSQRATPDRMLEAAPQRGQPLEQPGPSETPTPLRTSETEATRIAQPDPAAVQKVAIDTRTRKVVDALRGKDFTSIDDIAKVAKINKTSAEDAVMTLYGAQMVEILPGNKIRLIDEAAAAKVGDLFERAKTYGQTPEIPKPAASQESAPLASDKPAAGTAQKPTVRPTGDFKVDDTLAGQTVRNSKTGDILTLTGEVNPNGTMLAKNQFGRDVRISKGEWDRLKAEEKPLVEPQKPGVIKPVKEATPDDIFAPKGEILKPDTPTVKPPEVKTASRHRSLSQFVRAMGGINMKGDAWKGEIRRVSNKEMGTTGLINSKSGMSLDDMALRAVEAGYIAERDNDAFLRALEEDASGAKKHYTAEYYNDLQDAIEADYEAEYEKEVVTLAEMVKNKDVAKLLAGIEARGTATDDERTQLETYLSQFGLRAGVADNILAEFEANRSGAIGQAGTATETGEVRAEDSKGDAYFDPDADLDDSFNPAEFETEFAIAEQGTPKATSAAGKLKEQRDTAKRQAETSAVTGLPNKIAFEKARPRIEADPSQEITSIDLNKFKLINDRNSHIVGDQALNDAGSDLENAAKAASPQAQVFHLSGDEFAITSPTGTGQRILAAADKIFSNRKYGEVRGSIGGHTAQTYKEAEAGLQEAKARRKAVRTPDVVAERVAQQVDDNADAFTEDVPAVKESLTTERPSLTQTPPQDLTPTMTARVRYAMESGMTPPDIAQRYNLTPEQVASVKPLEPVGAAGQTSHKLIRKFTPSSTALPEERAEKIAGINDLAGYMNLADVRVARDDKPADIKTAFDAVRLAIATSFGHDRLSQMTPENWQTFLDAAGTQLEVPTIEKIVDALNHQADWNVKATAFVNDSKLGRMLDEIDDKIGLANVTNFKTLPLQDRKAIIALGESHGLKPHAIGQAFNQTFLDFAREESEAAALGRGSEEGARAGEEETTSGRPRQEEELDEIQFARDNPQTDTPAFKKWFGDSKVVDADGKPLVVYHGSSSERTEFRPTVGERYSGLKTELVPQHASFFTEDRGYAEEHGDVVTEVYVKLENPIDLRDGIDESFDAQLLKVAHDTIAIYEDETSYAAEDAWQLLDSPEGVARIKELGHDGAIMLEQGANGIFHETYAVFEPNQIKSAIGNRGTFDPNEDSILLNEIATTPVRDEQKPLVDKMRRLSGLPVRKLSHTAKASIDKDGVVHVNPAGAALLKNVVEEAQGKDPGAFGGLFAGPQRASQVSGILEGLADKNRNLTPLQNFKKTVDEATNNEFGDLTVVLSDPGNAALSKFSKQEELAHRANSRSGVREAFTAEFAAKAAIAKDLRNLQGYGDMKLRGRLDEVIAKNFRDDAETHLNKSTAEVAESITEFIDILNGAGIDLENYAREIESVSSRGQQFATTVRSRERVGETKPSRTQEGDTLAENPQDQRPSRDRSGTQFSETDPNRFARLRRTDAATRSGEGSGRESDNDRLALVSPKERTYIVNTAAGNQELAKAVEDEIQFSRAETKAKVRDTILDVLSSPKSLKSSLDLSATGRQGLISSTAHPMIAAGAFTKQIKSFFSPKAFEKFKRKLDIHPAIELAEASDLFLATLAGESSITEREESFMSRLFAEDPYFKNAAAEKLRKFLTIHVRASERAFNTYLDDLRINVFAQLAQQMHAYNVRKGRPDDIEQYKGLAAFVNYSTGRGDLGKFNDAAPYLNATFFSARYWMSRLQVMNPAFYATLPPGARMIAMREFTKFLGAMAALGLLLKAAGADIEFDDPDNPNAMSLKLGPYKYTMDAGLLKHVRFIWRMGMAAADGNVGKMTYLSQRYLRSSASPTLGAAWNTIEGKNYIGEPTSLTEELTMLPVPISVDNFAEAVEKDGAAAGLMKMSPEIFGVSVARFRDVEEIQEKINEEQAILDKATTPEARKEQLRRIKIWTSLKTRAIKYAAEDRKKAAAGN